MKNNFAAKQNASLNAVSVLGKQDTRKSRIYDFTAVALSDRNRGTNGNSQTQAVSHDGETGDIDIIKQYLQDAGQYALITPAREIELAKLIKKGDRKAREEMICANLRLVVKIAKAYMGIGLPFLDLISEGNIGLMKGVQRFDPRKGGKLSTYASWWIKQSIKRALGNQGKTVRLPIHMIDKISNMRRTEERLQAELDREPTDEELADEISTTAQKVRRMRTVGQRPVDLDSPIGNDNEGFKISDVVADENAVDPAKALEIKFDKDRIEILLKVLTGRERSIMTMRFGLDGGKRKTLEEVGVEFKVTRERIRQIEAFALRKLRSQMRWLGRINPNET